MGPVNEHSSALYTALLRSATGMLVPGSALTAAKLTLYDVKTGQIINSRENQNVLGGAGGVVIDDDGNITWTMDPADNTVISQSAKTTSEEHVALWLFEWPDGHHHHEVTITVTAMKKVS